MIVPEDGRHQNTGVRREQRVAFLLPPERRGRLPPARAGLQKIETEKIERLSLAEGVQGFPDRLIAVRRQHAGTADGEKRLQAPAVLDRLLHHESFHTLSFSNRGKVGAATILSAQRGVPAFRTAADAPLFEYEKRRGLRTLTSTGDHAFVLQFRFPVRQGSYRVRCVASFRLSAIAAGP